MPPSGSAITIENYRLFNSIGDQIGVAIERARLYKQAKEQRTREQQILLGHGQMLLGERKPQTILNQTIKVVSDALRVEFALLALVASDGNISMRTDLGFSSSITQDVVDISLVDNSTIFQSIRIKMPVINPDLNLEKQLKINIDDQNIILTSSLIVPMLMGEEALGCIAVYSQSPRQWSEDEIRLLSLLANQTAVPLRIPACSKLNTLPVNMQRFSTYKQYIRLRILSLHTIQPLKAGPAHSIFVTKRPKNILCASPT